MPPCPGSVPRSQHALRLLHGLLIPCPAGPAQRAAADRAAALLLPRAGVDQSLPYMALGTLPPAIRAVLLRSLNLPCCFHNTSANKGRAFSCALTWICWFSSIAAVGALSKLDGISVLRGFQSVIKRCLLSGFDFGLSIRDCFPLGKGCCG